jgi:hypothetical protein
MLEARCHCGAVKIEIPKRPRRLTSCNCSICRRYATLWAYYPAAEVRIHSARAGFSSYTWGERGIRFMRCRRCGCVTHWQAARKPRSSRMGVNTRNIDPALLSGVRIRHLDGADSWKFLD